MIRYITTIIGSLSSFLKGMWVTGGYFVHPGRIITDPYPENRENLKLPERYRGEVVLTHNENNEHRCTGCSACEIACPNGSIKILNYMEEIRDEKLDKVKKKKRLDHFVYHLSMCTFCNLCIEACPTGAIVMDQEFEHAVLDRMDLTKKLNRENSTLTEDLR